MAYTPHTWLARIGEDLNRFLDTTTGKYSIFQSAPTSISQEGTPFNATWMNEMESGIEQGASRINQNQLINAYFLSPVNQRGATSYNAVNQYGIDRWMLYGASPSVTINSSGVVVTGGSIVQYVENLAAFEGTTFTLSAQQSGGDVQSITGVLSTSTVSSSGSYDMEFYISGENVFVRLGIGTWEWAKLEVGPYASEFSPRPYSEELSLCQRYYRLYSICIFHTNGWYNNSANITIALGIPMRVVPSLKTQNITRFYFGVENGNGSIAGCTGATIGGKTSDTRTVNINFTRSGNFNNANFNIVNLNDDAWFALDAEIYS